MARRTYWLDTLVSATAGNGSNQALTLLGPFTAQETQGWTLTRVVLELALSAQGAGPDGLQIFDVGVGLAEQDAFAAGALPDPNVATDEPARGWVWRTRCLVPRDADTIRQPIRCMGDFRAQRKVDGAEVFVIFTNILVEGTAFTVRLVGIVRCLYLLP